MNRRLGGFSKADWLASANQKHNQGGTVLKKQSNLSRLLDYAGTYRILSYLSWVLAAAGALLALVPFWYIWRILREVIEVAPNYENAVHVTHYG